MKSIPEVCEILKITEDQLYRRYKAYDIHPTKIRGVTVFTDEELEILKMEPKYMSQEALGKFIGVKKDKLVLSDDFIEVSGIRLYNTKETVNLTPKPDTTSITSETLMSIFHKPYYRILAAIPDEMKRNSKQAGGTYPEDVIDIVMNHFETYVTVADIIKDFPINQKTLLEIIAEDKIEPAKTIKETKEPLVETQKQIKESQKFNIS